ncbi:MAG: glycosyltransferase family 39 protein [Patescibacteria group bacterium]
MKERLIVLSILILSFLLRILNIENSPASLYGDELTIVLDSYSLLKTGQDQLGNSFPLTFQMGAGRPAGYVYGSIPFMAIFGPTALGVRALSILSGIGIIILLYFLGRKLFSTNVGLAASFIAAFSPWDISLSRGGFEAHFALFLALLGFYLFIKAKEKPLFYTLSAISFGLTLHTYPTYKIILPLFLPLIFWFTSIKKVLSFDKKYFSIGVLLLLILGFLSISQTFIGGSETRFYHINIFSKVELKDAIEQKINFERSITNLPKSFLKYFHNKAVEYTKLIGENYLQNFSLDFLILHGDRNPRHNMATIGELYFVEAILILVGIFAFWQKQKKTILFLLLGIILAPIPTAIVDSPHALRSSFMLPFLILLSALGLVAVIRMKNKVVFYIVCLLFAIQFAFFLQKLYFLAPNEYSSFWSNSAKVASEYALQNKDKYKYVFLSDRIDAIEFAYPVYGKIEPLTVISQNQNSTTISSYKFKKFDNIYIGYIPQADTNQFIENLDGSVLFIDTAGSIENLKNYEIITGKDGRPILTVKKVY